MRNKIKTLEEMKEIVKRYKEQGKRIATTNGSFDLLHIGHMYILEGAKRFTDILIVFLNSDNSIKRAKGPKRPIVPEKERAEMLSCLECVDYVVIFEEDKPLMQIKEIKPDFHIKGGSFVFENIKEERELITSWGGKHIILPPVEGYSTTNLISNILKSYDENYSSAQTNKYSSF